MARAHTIWIVVSDTEGVPIRAFTVKHELKTWLDRRPDFLKEYWIIWSMRDGATEVNNAHFVCRADDKEAVEKL